MQETLGVTAQPQPHGNSSQECWGWLPTPIPTPPHSPSCGTRGLPRGRKPQKPEKRAPSGTFLQKMRDPPTPPASENERKREKKKKAAFGGRRPQRSNMKGRAGLTHAFHTPMHRSWQAQAAEVGWRHPRAQPNQQTGDLPPRAPAAPFVPHRTGFPHFLCCK